MCVAPCKVKDGYTLQDCVLITEPVPSLLLTSKCVCAAKGSILKKDAQVYHAAAEGFIKGNICLPREQ